MQYNSPEQFGEMPQVPLPVAQKTLETLRTPEEIFAENRGSVIKKAAEAGIILDNEMRIDMDAAVFPGNNVAKDLKRADLLELQELKEILPKDRKNFAESKKYGEKFADLIVINFSKLLGDDFLVAKASKYDKAANGVDVVIFDKKAGSLVCAFGGVGDLHDFEVKERMTDILKKNSRVSKAENNMEYQGVELAYGLKKMPDGEIKGEERLNIPAIALAAPKTEIIRGLKEMSGPDSITDSERELFAGLFFTYVSGQVESLLGGKPGSQNSEFRNNLTGFWKICEDLKKTHNIGSREKH